MKSNATDSLLSRTNSSGLALSTFTIESGKEDARGGEPIVNIIRSKTASSLQWYSNSPALKAWSFDLVCCIAAVLALAAIIITLAVHNGASLPSWPLGITINALISVFAVLFKVTVLVPVAGAISQLKWAWFREPHRLSEIVDFDNASRGNLWSSAVLIFRTKAIRLPALGGLIMILAIATDPFIQQVVRYVPCPQPLADSAASVARTNNYTKHGIHTGALLESLDAPMQAAIYKGVYNAWAPPVPNCPSGNCTFPEFRTVGMCSHCDDITSDILHTPNFNSTTGPAWKLKSGLWVGYGNPYVFNMSTSYNEGMAAPMTTTETLAVTNFTQYTGFANPYDPNRPNKTAPWTPWRPSGENFLMAARCSLQPCIHATKVSVNSSRLTENTTKAGDMENPPPPNKDQAPAFWSWNAAPMPCLINGKYFSASAFVEKNQTNNIPVQGLLPNNQTAYLPEECYFEYATTLGLGQYLEQFLNGYYMAAPEVAYGNPTFIGQLWKHDPQGWSLGSSFSLVNDTWTNLAASMSAHIRSSGDPVGSLSAIGTTFQDGTCLVVRWPWLSYPIVLLFLTIVLFLATATGGTTHQLWRDSPLALLFHGVDEGLRRRVRGIEDKDLMGKVARGVWARLVDEGEGAEFREVEGG